VGVSLIIHTGSMFLRESFGKKNNHKSVYICQSYDESSSAPLFSNLSKNLFDVRILFFLIYRVI